MLSNFDSDYFFLEHSHPHFMRERYLEVVQICIAATSKIYGCDFEVFTPMGFEVFKDASYFSRKLRRFYFYLYASDLSVDAAAVEATFLNEFIRECSARDPRFADSIAVMAARSGAHTLLHREQKEWKHSDRLVVAEFRKTHLPPIEDYAQYLLCCIPAIINDLIPETRRFSSRSMARTRIFQIFLILNESLLTRFLKMPHISEDMFFITSRHQSAAHFYFDPNFHEKPTEAELSQYENILRHLKIANILLKEKLDVSEAFQIRVKAFHGDIFLSHEVPHDIYMNFVAYLDECHKYAWERAEE